MVRHRDFGPRRSFETPRGPFSERKQEGLVSRTYRRVKMAGCGLTVLLTVAGVGALWNLPHFFRDTYVAKVTDKTTRKKGDDDFYLVFTKLVPSGEVRVFQNSDSLIEWKRKSSDIQGDLEVGKTYSLDTYGWRFSLPKPLPSGYENISGYEEVPQ